MTNIQKFTPVSPVENILSALDHDGAAIIVGLADERQLATQLKPYLEQSKASDGPFYGYNTHRIGGLISKSKICQNLATHPLILAVMDHLLLPSCDKYQLNLTQAIEIKPGERAQFLHRDDAMFPTAGVMESMVNVIYAVTDFTADNGATRLIPGSHNWPADRQPLEGETVSCEMPAGSCLIYRGSVLHAGSANISEEGRIGAVISYGLGWLKQAENFFLSIPWETVQDYPVRLQNLLGYQLHKPNLGWVEGVDPLEWINMGRPQISAAKDALPEDLIVLAEHAMKAPEQYGAYLS